MKSKLLPLCLYSYIALPFVIFALGFLRARYALPAALAVIVSVFLAFRASEGTPSLSPKRSDIFKLLLGSVIILAVTLLSGIGGVLWQNSDHATRNTIFEILVNEDWPVLHRTDKGLVSIVYYIGFWLPSAVVGKLTTLRIGCLFQIFWAALGIFLVWLLLCSFHKRTLLWPLVVFLFFSGLDVGGHFIVTHFFDASKLQIGSWASAGGFRFTYHLEWWAKNFQFSSHLSQLFWVFNQALPTWAALFTLLSEKNNKNLVFIMGLTLLSSPFPFVGLIPIFIWCAVTDKDALLSRTFTKTPLKSFRSLFTFQNIVGGGVSGIVTFLYLKGNIASGNTTASSRSASSSHFPAPEFFLLTALSVLFFIAFYRGSKKKISSYLVLLPMLVISYLFSTLSTAKSEYYLLFIFFEVLIFAFCVYPVYGQSSIFYITVFSLMIIPFFRVGKSIDFCMRASIPALCMLCLCMMFSLKKYLTEKKIVPSIILIIVLSLGAVTPMHEIARTVVATYNSYEKYGEVKNKTKSISSVMNGGNFTGTVEDSFFFEYLAK